ncbi:Serine/threonine protein kinase [Trichophyton interdigitale]|nr:Serine/threonine protein kinase [Trichophyton interdigitale]KAG5216847.1 Serine/threonine protein kinase [Trichophyton interdigitale]KAG8205382.1 Serine/threonine protein kinase [Trichophyton interdigitale]
MISSGWRFRIIYCVDDLVDVTTYIIDCETLRCLQLIGPTKLLADDDSFRNTFAAAQRYVGQLGPDNHTIIVDKNGDLVKLTSENVTMEIRYPKYTGTMDKHQVIRRSELTEVDRFDNFVDLVEYNSSDSETKKERAFFKYTLNQNWIKRVWEDLHIHKALQGNEHFVPFHRIVIDDVTENILGFTYKSLSGSSLYDYQGVFNFCWLKQMTDAVDELNLRYGVLHLDICPHNFLIDHTRNEVKLRDFSMVVKIGEQPTAPLTDVDSLIVWVYQTLTGDRQFVDKSLHQAAVSKIEEMAEWKLQRPIEDGFDISDYRKYLKDWSGTRRATQATSHSCEVPEPLSWPEYPEPQLPTSNRGYGPSGQTRAEAEEAGDYVTRWERPAQREMATSN